MEEKGKLMIVEDEPRFAESLAIGLRESGYLPYVVHDGIDGLKMLRDQEFNFIICDINMPVMDGWEFACKAKAYSTARFIFMTADPYTIKAKELKNYPLLIKPIKIKMILQLLSDETTSKPS